MFTILLIALALILGGILLFNTIVSYTPSEETAVRIGSQAPDFSLQDEQGVYHSLSSLRGHKVALIFYPHPNTPGCTKEVCSIQDKFSELQKTNITVLGISKSSPEALKRFREAQHLSFPLLQATPEVLKSYKTTGDIWSFFLPKRVTVLINEQGKIVAVITTVDFEHHADQILAAFSKAEANGSSLKEQKNSTSENDRNES